MSLHTRRTIAMLLSALLAACGGGSGDSVPASSGQPATPSSAGGSTSGGETPATPTTPATSGTPPVTAPTGTPGDTPPSTGSNGGTSTSTFKVDETARFNLPSDLAADKAGNLYVMDRGNQAIRRIAASGDVSTLPGSYAATSRLAIGPSGMLFVLSGIDLYKVAPDGGKTLIKSYAQGPGSYQPQSLSLDAQGRIYVLLQYRNIFRVQRIDPDNGTTNIYYVNTYGGAGDIATNDAGNLAVGITAMGGPAVTADGSGINTSHIDVAPLAAQSNADSQAPGVLHWPVDDIYATGKLLFGTGGNIYAAGAAFSAATTPGTLVATDMRIGKVAPDGTVTTILNGFPNGDNTPRQIATDIRANPGIATGKNGELYLADPFDQAIYRIDPSGQISLVAGKPGKAGNAD
ncbi:NHL repeat-containing protein [Noviherbaspirillum autotrophicum]|uniref:hypothetical protein n=1 Tax=Noviherbaspirillum autotrophicum TaxID=709839 RepID=UPI0018DF4BD7|nr:hypothetical protein [Noviherbaspirillum autotrophicum]